MALPTGFLTGFRYPFRGIRMMLAHRVLWLPAVLPIVLNLLLYSGFGWVTFHHLAPWAAGWVPAAEGWGWAVLRGAFYLIFGLLFLLAVVYTFVGVGSLLAGPFSDPLSERTERLMRGRVEEAPFRLNRWLREARYALRHEALKLGFFLVCLATLTLLNLIPAVGNAAYAVLNPLVTLTFLAVNYLDVPMSRRRLGFGAKWRAVRGRWIEVLGFGAAVFVILFIPGLNFLLIGGAVVGASAMYLERMEPKNGVTAPLPDIATAPER